MGYTFFIYDKKFIFLRKIVITENFRRLRHGRFVTYFSVLMTHFRQTATLIRWKIVKNLIIIQKYVRETAPSPNRPWVNSSRLKQKLFQNTPYITHRPYFGW